MNVHGGHDTFRERVTVEKDPASEWSPADLRALSTALGPQVMVVQLPPVPTVPWCSIDEQAGFTINDNDEIVIRTTGPLTPYTTTELATALTAYIVHYHQQQTHNTKGGQTI